MQILRVILCYQNRWFCHNLICFQMRQFSPTSLENFLMGRIWTKYGYVQTEMFWIPFDYYHYVVIGLLRSILQVIGSCERQSWNEGVCDHSRFWLSCLGPFVILISKILKLFLNYLVFQIEWLWVHLIKDIPETRRARALSLISTFLVP